jgi:hypothetical protein
VRFAVLTDMTSMILMVEASGSSKPRYIVTTLQVFTFQIILAGEPGGKRLFWRPSYRCKDNIKTDFK